MRFDPDRHHRRSIRLKDYDYTKAGAYFVTICTQNRECLFGEITEGRMRLNQYGQIVENEWWKTTIIRPNITLDAFVVMPNHIHGIIMVTHSVGATRRVAPTNHPTGPQSGSIGAIIGQFKSIVAKRINERRDTPRWSVWQSNYYERIIRNDEEMNRIREYIANNPAGWATDVENPAMTDALRVTQKQTF